MSPSDLGDPIFLIDGTAFIFRGYYGSKPMAAVDGTPTNGVFGFTQLLVKLLRTRRPAAVALVFDAGAHTFRNDLYPAYKANRGAPPEDMIPQFDLCEAVGEALGLRLVSLPGFEADDVMATLAQQAEAAGRSALVVTGDKDMAQVVTEKVWLLDPNKDEVIDAAGVRERFGVAPSQVPDWLAIVGDSSDNIPGIPGLGAKAASQLLTVFGGLEELYLRLPTADLGPVRGPDRARRLLAEHRDTAFLARTLATVRRDAPVGVELADLAWPGADPARYSPLFDRLGFGWINTRIGRELPAP